MHRLAFAAVFAAAFPLHSAFAWGPTGHRVTDAIAERYLTPQTKAALGDILGPESLAEASTWPDFMRASQEEFWKKAGPFHFVTVPPGQSYADVQPPAGGDSVTTLKRFRDDLKNPASTLAQRQLALRFIVHIVGDLHQPLHAGKPGDKGGNEFQVIYFGEPTNLHALWDSGLIDRQDLSYTEMTDWLARKITPEQLKGWMNLDPLVWIAESVELRDRIYPAAGEVLGFEYEFKHLADLNLRLAQGGVRIAAYLNDVLKP